MKYGKQKGLFSNNSFIRLHDDQWIADLRVAGKCCAEIMVLLEDLIKNETKLSLLDLDNFIGEEITKRNCIATFKDYKKFPNFACISVNNELVHGVPKQRYLKQGDLISFDFGATYNNSIADTAITMIFGHPKSNEDRDLIETTKLCLDNAIKAVAVGKRIGVIGDIIYKTAKNDQFRTINTYGGHGIVGILNGQNLPHGDPFICNRAEPNEGVRIQNNMVFAIEPLLTRGDTKTYIDPLDNWTVTTVRNNSHFEHTIAIVNNKVEVVTQRANESI
jgi:methionyl aminopeptidase